MKGSYVKPERNTTLHKNKETFPQNVTNQINQIKIFLHMGHNIKCSFLVILTWHQSKLTVLTFSKWKNLCLAIKGMKKILKSNKYFRISNNYLEE